jgi:hypothetical protein
VQPGLILSEDFPPLPHYLPRSAFSARRSATFLQSQFPLLLQLSDLRRDPHLFAWFRHLCQQHPPLSSNTRQKYLFALRRLSAHRLCRLAG